jgi:hypothetical protein
MNCIQSHLVGRILIQLKNFSRVWNDLPFSVVPVETQLAFYGDKSLKRNFENSYSAENCIVPMNYTSSTKRKFPATKKKNLSVVFPL